MGTSPQATTVEFGYLSESENEIAIHFKGLIDEKKTQVVISLYCPFKGFSKLLIYFWRQIVYNDSMAFGTYQQSTGYLIGLRQPLYYLLYL
jgi:hypothetical protein